MITKTRPMTRNTCLRLASTQATPSSQGRWAYTGEIMVSKLFPAGFGWQAASCIADSSFGLADTSAGFALMTGLGDMTGVICGHMLYKTVQSGVAKDMNIDLGGEFKTAVWLGTAAFCAGSSWQPIVNYLHGTCELGFTSTFVGVTGLCGSVFFAGLALGRTIYPWMPALGTGNSVMQDAGLCLSIGGATAMFVATDGSFNNADMLYSLTAPVFNITDDMSTLAGCATAGASTFTGFAIYNSVQNVLLPAGSNWMDNNNPYAPADEVVEEEEEGNSATA